MSKKAITSMFSEEDMNAPTTELEEYLWILCADVEAVRHLMKLGANPSCLDDHAISLASKNGHASMLNLMLDNSEVEPRNFDPLITASANGHIHCVRVLLGHCRWDKETLTVAIESATINKHHKVVRLLKGHLCDRCVNCSLCK